MDDVVARLKDAPGGAAVNGLRHVGVPLVVGVVLRIGLGARPALRAVEDHVDDAGLPGIGPRHDRGVDARWIGDDDRGRRRVPGRAGRVGLDHGVIAVGPDRVDGAARVDGSNREDAVVPRTDRAVVDLVVAPADDRGAGCWHVRDGDIPIHAVKTSRRRLDRDIAAAGIQGQCVRAVNRARQYNVRVGRRRVGVDRQVRAKGDSAGENHRPSRCN